MELVVLLLAVFGLVLLVAGAELLVRGASRLATTIGISPLVIGLTVVAYGTSSPELAVSLQSVFSGETGADIALGNIVGSNILNILFILGLSALITPLVVAQELVRKDVPILIAISVLTFALAFNGNISRWEGGLLSAGAVGYTVFAIKQGRKESREVEEEYAQEYGEKPSGARLLGLNLILIIVGLAMLVIGSNWLVDGAITVAQALGISHLVIGLTIVAAGTSLPEVATSVLASFKGERDIAVGNVIGSSIFNILAVLGLSAFLTPEGINVEASALRLDIPIMIVVAFATLPIFFTNHTLARWEGALFLFYYVAYTVFLILTVSRSGILNILTPIMILFVAPLTLITIAVTVVRQIKKEPR